MLQLAQRLRFNLADTLARHAELLTHLFQRVIGVHPDTETHAQHPLLTRGVRRRQNPRRGFLQVFLNGTESNGSTLHSCPR